MRRNMDVFNPFRRAGALKQCIGPLKTVVEDVQIPRIWNVENNSLGLFLGQFAKTIRQRKEMVAYRNQSLQED